MQGVFHRDGFSQGHQQSTHSPPGTNDSLSTEEGRSVAYHESTSDEGSGRAIEELDDLEVIWGFNLD